ncbi:MAG: hypothetical protein VX519_11160 [Myxococcota bacterium]|nr:hypothetical protein [Myxococcota bacterium]
MSTRTHAFLLVLITAGVFCPLLVAGFIWDDQVLVLENLWTHDPANLPRFFRASLWESTPIANTTTPYYRPMMLVELLVDRQLFGFSTLAHHAHSLAWHLVCTLLVWKLIRTLGGQGIAATASAAVFALHPFQTEVVAFIAARNDAMALAGVLGALLLLKDEAPSPWRLTQAGICALYALLSKETALMLPLLLAMCDLVVHGRLINVRRYLAIGLAMGVFGLLRLQAPLDSSALNLGEVLQSAPAIMASYASRLLWPIGTSPTTPLNAIQLSLPSLGIALFLAGLALRAQRKMALCGLGIFVVGLTPALAGVVLYGGLPYRYTYLPMLGIAIGYCALWNKHTNHPASLLLPLILGGITTSQLVDWSTNLSFWERGYQVAPGVETACGLFKAHESELHHTELESPQRKKRFDRAEALLQEAIQNPPSQYCCYSASRWYWKLGLPQSAVTSGLEALNNGCEPSPELLAPLAMSEALIGQWDAAESHAKEAGRDPTGLAPVVLSAAALRRGDESVLLYWEQKGSNEAQINLRDQVDFVLNSPPPIQPNSSVSPTDESESP